MLADKYPLEFHGKGDMAIQLKNGLVLKFENVWYAKNLPLNGISQNGSRAFLPNRAPDETLHG